MRQASRIAALLAVLYFLIGLGLLHIGTRLGSTAEDLLPIGASAGFACLVAAILLLVVRRCGAWILMGVLDVMVIVFYFAVASIRQPPYEVWGLLIEALEVCVFILAVAGRLITRFAYGRSIPAPT